VQGRGIYKARGEEVDKGPDLVIRGGERVKGGYRWGFLEKVSSRIPSGGLEKGSTGSEQLRGESQ